MTSDKDSARRPDELILEPVQWSRNDEIKESIHMLLSHHPPSLYGHCLRVSYRGRSIYFCGRCSGIYGGLGLGLIILFFSGISLEPDWLWFMFSLAVGFATVVDWVSQRLTPRKTTNTVRALTGFFSGFSLAIIFFLGNLFYMLVALAIMGTSIGGVGYAENRRTRKMKEAIDALDAEDDD